MGGWGKERIGKERRREMVQVSQDIHIVVKILKAEGPVRSIVREI